MSGHNVWTQWGNAHCWIMSSLLILTQSLEIDYSKTIRAIVMKLKDNKNESPKNALKTNFNANICPKYEKMLSSVEVEQGSRHSIWDIGLPMVKVRKP